VFLKEGFLRRAQIILSSPINQSIIENSGIITVTGDDYHHLMNVLRMKKGDEVEVIGANIRYYTNVIDILKNSVTLQIAKTCPMRKNPFYISMIIPVMVPDKMEYMVQKLTELGVDEIILTFFKRCEHKLKETNIIKKQDRMFKICREAANQSFNDIIPEISFASSLFDAIKMISQPYMLLAFFEYGAKFTVKEAMRAAGQDYKESLKKSEISQRKVVLVIGPAGSMDDEEKNFLIEDSALTVTINRNILRSETAAVAALAIVRNQELEFYRNYSGDTKSNII